MQTKLNDAATGTDASPASRTSPPKPYETRGRQRGCRTSCVLIGPSAEVSGQVMARE